MRVHRERGVPAGRAAAQHRCVPVIAWLQEQPLEPLEHVKRRFCCTFKVGAWVVKGLTST